MHAASIDAPAYAVGATDEDSIIARALAILAQRVQRGELLGSPQAVRQYLTVKAAQHSAREVFSVLFMDSQHRLIECREMFFGTLNQTSVYPREVVRAAIELRAAACILSHNHPNGDANPSRADETLTQMLKSALALIDVRVLDHIITAGGSSLSMAEHGMV